MASPEDQAAAEALDKALAEDIAAYQQMANRLQADDPQ